MPVRGVGLTIGFTVWDTVNNIGKTGDNANLTLRWGKDGSYSAPTNSSSEVDATNAKGEYKITLTNAEALADMGNLVGVSSTTGIVVMPTRISFESFPATRINLAQSATSSTITLDSGASATDNLYNGLAVSIIAGTGAGQGGRIITGYTGSSKAAAVTPNWTTTPDSTSVFALAPASVDIKAWVGAAVPSPAAAGIPDINVKNMNNVSGSAITAVRAVQGTTIDIPFSAGNNVKVDVRSFKDAIIATGGDLVAMVTQVDNKVQAVSDIIGTPNDGTVSQDIADLRQVADNISGQVSTVDSKLPAALSVDGFMQVDVQTVGQVAPQHLGVGYLDANIQEWKGIVPLGLVSQQVVTQVKSMQSSVIGDAQMVDAAETIGPVTGPLSRIRRIHERKSNKRTRDRNTGVESLRNAADTGNLEQSTQSTASSVDTITAAS